MTVSNHRMIPPFNPALQALISPGVRAAEQPRPRHRRLPVSPTQHRRGSAIAHQRPIHIRTIASATAATTAAQNAICLSVSNDKAKILPAELVLQLPERRFRARHAEFPDVLALIVSLDDFGLEAGSETSEEFTYPVRGVE